jgi:hypothetical protein
MSGACDASVTFVRSVMRISLRLQQKWRSYTVSVFVNEHRWAIHVDQDRRTRSLSALHSAHSVRNGG